MHEFTIISNIFTILNEIAEENSLLRINRVNLKIGKLRQISPEAFKQLFELVAKETKAENAILNMEIIPVKMKCKNCGNIFLVDNVFRCAKCDDFRLETIEGDEIIIESVEGDQ